MRLISFDGYTLPQARHAQRFQTALDAPIIQLPAEAGGFDVFGDTATRQAMTLTHSGLVYGTAAVIDAAIDALRGKTGKRGWLRVQTRAGVYRGTWAKLVGINFNDEVEAVNHLPVELTFQVAWPWLEAETDVTYFDAGKTFDSGWLLDGNYSTRTGAGSLTINNTGGDVIARGTIEIAGASTNPTISNAANGWSLAYAGMVASGSRLVIDMGAQTVTLNGADAWSAVILGTYNTGLMRLEKGSNVITFSGGGTLIWHWAKVY